MSIKTIEISNFTVFHNTKINFCNGINAIIGENGSGKTHLLKALYSRNALHYNEKSLHDYFGATTLATKNAQVVSDEQVILIPTINIDGTYNKSIFIPAKDILTHSKGFLSWHNEYQIPFDASYYDIVSKALLSNLKKAPPIGKNILPKIEKIIGGKVVVENEVFFIETPSGDRTPFSVEAEGIKRLAIIWQLLMNGSIKPNSILFWDEPEANINPNLIKDVVQILLELSRQGVQIFVTTHNYIFAKYVEVLAKDTDEVCFHSLYKTEDKGVQCESNRNFRDLEHNYIISSFDKLLDEVFDLDLGD